MQNSPSSTITAAAANPSLTSLYTYSPSPQASPVAKTFAEGNGGGECRALAKHSSAAYERIRTVGKGSFGIAVLYRRKEDDSFVILKEINLHELSPWRCCLGLDHPHIIHYFDSFEEDGTLMIEMEYADGGTLAQLLSHQGDQLLQEGQIIDIFEQITSATANIFLTNERMVKVGDFGISKRMSTATNIRGGAQTMLGTPYYLSPEMCEGRPYNTKADMWAMGCCLYEMCALRKPFDADNLPTLIHKIINSEYEPLKGPYSPDIRLMVRELFRTDPEQRPSAADLLEQIRRKNPLLNSTRRVKNEATKAFNKSGQNTKSNCYSALYRFDCENLTLLAMSELPDRVQIKQIALSVSHQLVLTVDERVYSWGENDHGQLGHGDRRVRNGPTLIEALRGKGVSRVAAGKHFSLFCAGRGIAMAAGQRQFVGSGAQADADLLRPKIIETLLKEDIVDICCGEEHAVVLTESGGVFVWGVGENGRLGTGHTKFVSVPTRIQIPTRQLINCVVCGPNATMLITNTGTVLAMGSNEHNKLNLNQRPGFFANAKKNCADGQKVGVMDNVLSPTAVKPFPSRVVNASLGIWHSGVLLENGHVHMFGRNLVGELGHGNCAEVPAGCTCPVKALMSKACAHLVCGDGFTMVGTLDNELYSWGMYKKLSDQQHNNNKTGTLRSEKMTSEKPLGGRRKKEQQQQQQQQKKTKKLEQVKGGVMELPRFEMSQTREGQLVRMTNANAIKVRAVMLQPHLMFRLDICQKSSCSSSSGGSAPADTDCDALQQSADCTGTAAGTSTTGGAGAAGRPRIALSALVGARSCAFSVVDVTTSAAAVDAAGATSSSSSSSQQPSRGRKNAEKRDPKGIGVRRSSAPDSRPMPAGTETWIREELDSAEIIPYSKFAISVRIRNASASRTNVLKNAQRLREEIALLRSQLVEHKSTVRGHQNQMSQLQVAQRRGHFLVKAPGTGRNPNWPELEALLKRHNSSPGLPPVNDPPPAYTSASPASKTNNELEQKQHHQQQQNSRTCAIL
ncbi:hypothetical protein GPALN_014657 [Globodera pallida]|nr:hypothetical protein GPALN_014657 [Globodera pallida]